MGSRRLLLLSIEAMELEMLRDGIRDGWLPTFGTVLHAGAGVRLKSAPHLMPGGDWATTITGRPPGEHLIMFFRQLRMGTYRIESVDNSHLRQPPFWRFVSDAGKTSTVLSVYGTPRLENFLGTQVSWGTPEPHAASGSPWSNPPEVVGWLHDAFPRRRWGFLPRLPSSEHELRSYLDDMRRGVREQAGATTMLMERTDWDLFFGNFAETHEGGHILWHLQDEAPNELRHALRQLYQEVDAALANVLEHTSADTSVFLLSPNGMRDAYPTVHATEAFLVQGGWLAHGGGGRGGRQQSSRWAARARTAARRMTPPAWRQKMASRWPAVRDKVDAVTSLADVDWARTTAFPLPHDLVSSIRVNMAGREPQGTVAPGTPYDRTCEDIASAALELVDNESGQPVTETVHRMAEFFGRPVDGSFADLMIEWSPRRVAALTSARTGRIDVPDVEGRTGYHTPHGFLVGRGPGIAAGGGDEGFDGAPASLLDVAPTILSALGVRVPDDLPGTPVTALADGLPEGS